MNKFKPFKNGQRYFVNVIFRTASKDLHTLLFIAMSTVSPFTQLEEKLVAELASNHPYEAQNYVQSFLARKKKNLGQNQTSQLVFLGVKLILEYGAGNDAGSLLVWFLEDGAGVDYYFNYEDSATFADDKYCDSQRLLDLLAKFPADKLSTFVEKIYGPLHIFSSKKNVAKNGALAGRLIKLEEIFADVFEVAKKWNHAYKSVIRLNDYTRVAKILNLWSLESYSNEQPLFFARVVLQLLADKKIEQSIELIEKSKPYIVDNAVPNVEPIVGQQGALACWHCAIILAELAYLPPLQRVDKGKLFTILIQLYLPIINQVDSKLVDILEKVGPNALNYVSPQQQQHQAASNPLQLFQNMLAGANNAPKQSAKGVGADGSFDINSMMSMINQLQGR